MPNETDVDRAWAHAGMLVWLPADTLLSRRESSNDNRRNHVFERPALAVLLEDAVGNTWWVKVITSEGVGRVGRKEVERFPCLCSLQAGVV